jgi:hypothetical protein
VREFFNTDQDARSRRQGRRPQRDLESMADPDVRHGKILWPNTSGANSNAVWAQAQAAALAEAESSVADDEMVVDLQLHGGVAQKGAGGAVMVFSYSYQVVPPGGQAAARRR